MKKLLVIFLLFCFLFCFSGCRNDNTDSSGDVIYDDSLNEEDGNKEQYNQEQEDNGQKEENNSEQDAGIQDENNIDNENENKVENDNGNDIENTEEDKNDEEVFIMPQDGERPLSFVIDNQGDNVLPQGGIAYAQIVYELYVEGGITRLLALLWGGQIPMAGPVRSTRHYFLDYIMEYDALHIHYGYSPQAKADISEFNIDSINGVTGKGYQYFFDITDDPDNWQDSYIKLERVSDFIGNYSVRKETQVEYPFTYNKEDAGLDGIVNAEKINVKYSGNYSCSYEYDEKKSCYLRYRNNEPHMERINDKQVAVKNIIIMYVNNYTIEGDAEGRQEFDTVGSGSGWYFTMKKAKKITWEKTSRQAQTVYKFENGDEIKLNKGNLWIQVMPVEVPVEIR